VLEKQHGKMHAIQEILQCIEGNFLSQAINIPTQGDAILDLMVTSARELIGGIKTRGSLGAWAAVTMHWWS